MKKEITEKYAKLDRKTAILRVIANKSNVSFATVRQRWFNSKLEYPIPEKWNKLILTIIDKQLSHEINIERPHYKSFDN